MENSIYNWKITKTINRKIIKLVDLMDSNSSSVEDDNEHKIKIIFKKTFKKRKTFDVWYDKLMIPDDLINDTVKFNCSLNNGISSDELFKITTIDDLVPLYVLKLKTNPTNLEESNNPRIDKIYVIYERNGSFVKIKNIEDKNDNLELCIKNGYAYNKLSVLCINPSIVL
jgi:hypothetical protein